MLRLEKFTDCPADFALLTSLVQREEVMKPNLGRVFTAEEAAGFFRSILECGQTHETLGYYKVYHAGSGAFLGMGALSPDGEAAAELEYMLLPECWGQGLGTALAARLLEAAQGCGVTTVTATIDPENAASRRVLQKNGFRLEQTGRNPDGEMVETYVRRAAERAAAQEDQRR